MEFAAEPDRRPGRCPPRGGEDRDRLPLAKVRALVVEDEPLIALDVQQALEAAGAAVTVARRVEPALSLLEEGGPAFDVALLDVNLGRGATCEPIARRLREIGLPFALHSGDLVRRGELIASLDAPLIAKPASNDAIVASLARLLR